MTPLSLEQIRSAVNGELINGDPAFLIYAISTDSRTSDLNSLFIAIKGETHDGHKHFAKATAAAVMVHENVQTDLPVIRVDDTRKAMGRLANYIRRRLRATVIAVAGSNGKTGTKNLLHAALRNSLTGTISAKSFNNDIGVPRTIFDASPDQDYVVLEIGTQHPGEILNLTMIAEPDVAIITNIGAEHLEFLGDLDGVRKENAQIIAGMNPDGLLVINGDSPSLVDAVAAYPGRKITFGFDFANNLHPTNVVCGSDGIRFRLEGHPIFIALMGRHTAVNALAAVAVGRHLGISDAAIIAGLATAKGPEMRLQLQTAGSIKILNDAYNANPQSMQAGLETLRDMETAGRRVAILGDMRELGATADRYHREVGEFAADCDLDFLICVGEKAGLIAHAARDAGLSSEFIQTYPTAVDCAADVSSFVCEDDLILLKGSRGVKLETVATAIISMMAGEGLRRTIDARMKAVITDRNVAARL